MLLPTQDDKSFDALWNEARRLIPLFAPQWTDHNYHDPGLTFIELFAWLCEMQHYYMDRVGDRNFLKFLKLLGKSPAGVKPARCTVAFKQNSPSAASLVIPSGTRIAAGDTVFETREPLVYVTNRIGKIISSTPRGYTDNTALHRSQALSFYAFGPDAQPGSRLYLGLEKPLPMAKKIALTVELFEDYPVAPGSGPEETTPRFGCTDTAGVWEFGTSPGNWLPVNIEVDETKNLSRSGRIVFTLPQPMTAFAGWDGWEGCWLRAIASPDGYDIAPRINRVLLNTSPAVQQETLVETVRLHLEQDTPLTFLCLAGWQEKVQAAGDDWGWQRILLQASRDGKRWFDCAPHHRKNHACHFVIREGDILSTHGIEIVIQVDARHWHARVVKHPGDFPYLRLTAWSPALDEDGWLLGAGSGLPGQCYHPNRLDILPASFQLQVLHQEEGIPSWQDWIQVEDFDASNPEDHHYIFNRLTGEIQFGDGLQGAVPPAPMVSSTEGQPSGNIRVIACRTSQGAGGNIAGTTSAAIIDHERLIQPVSGKKASLAVSLCDDASHGADAESISGAVAAVRRELKATSRAVTARDYEELACNTPGVRVARACVVENDDENSTAITVAVVPYSTKAISLPGQDFLKAVCRHLNRHRLLTTRVQVVPPSFVKVTVTARVVFKTGYSVSAEIVAAALQGFLRPIDGASGEKGWPFGRPVYVSEIYGVIEKAPGVDFVENVVLSGEGDGIVLDVSGSLIIPPYSLVYSGEHMIEAAAPRNSFVCRRRGGGQ